MSAYILRRSATLLLNVVADTSMKLDRGNITKEEARAEQQKIAKKVVARYGLKIVFGALPVYRHSLLDAVKDGKLMMETKKGDRKSAKLITCYSYGIDDYFRSRWPDNWKKINTIINKKRAEIRKKLEKKEKK